MSSVTYKYRVPRSFKLRQELERAEKGSKDLSDHKSSHDAWVTFGLDDNLYLDEYNLQLKDWNASIIGIQNTNIGDRIYQLKVICHENFPEQAPEVYFKSKMKMKYVNQSTGKVELSKFMKWNRKLSIHDALVAIRKEMVKSANSKQPPAHETYF